MISLQFQPASFSIRTRLNNTAHGGMKYLPVQQGSSSAKPLDDRGVLSCLHRSVWQCHAFRGKHSDYFNLILGRNGHSIERRKILAVSVSLCAGCGRTGKRKNMRNWKVLMTSTVNSYKKKKKKSNKKKDKNSILHQIKRNRRDRMHYPLHPSSSYFHQFQLQLAENEWYCCASPPQSNSGR